MGFKENLKSELEYKGMSVKELASKSGAKKQTLDNYLSTHNSIPNAALAVKIAKALDTTVEYLITGQETDTQNPKKESSADLRELIKKYKSLSKEKRSAVLHIVDVM